LSPKTHILNTKIAKKTKEKGKEGIRREEKYFFLVLAVQRERSRGYMLVYKQAREGVMRRLRSRTGRKRIRVTTGNNT
jgi:hypothetical protein